MPTLQRAILFCTPRSRTSRQRDHAVTSTQQTRQLLPKSPKERAASLGPLPLIPPSRLGTRPMKTRFSSTEMSSAAYLQAAPHRRPRTSFPPRRRREAAAILSICLRNSRHGLPSICISGHEQKTENHNAVTTRQVCHPKSSPCPRGVTKPHTDPRAEAAEKGHSELVQAGQHRFAAALKMSPEVPTQEGPPRSSQRRGSPGLGDPAVWQ